MDPRGGCTRRSAVAARQPRHPVCQAMKKAPAQAHGAGSRWGIRSYTCAGPCIAELQSSCTRMHDDDQRSSACLKVTRCPAAAQIEGRCLRVAPTPRVAAIVGSPRDSRDISVERPCSQRKHPLCARIPWAPGDRTGDRRRARARRSAHPAPSTVTGAERAALRHAPTASATDGLRSQHGRHLPDRARPDGARG